MSIETMLRNLATSLRSRLTSINEKLTAKGYSEVSSFEELDDNMTIIASGSGTEIETQEKTVTPSTAKQIVEPDSGKLLSKVTVEAMNTGVLAEPYITVDNATGVIAVINEISTSGYLNEGDFKVKEHALTINSGGIFTASESDQTVVSAGTYLTGDVVIKAVESSDGEVIEIETQEKTVVPSTSEQVVEPDQGKYLSRVTVEAMATGTLSKPTMSIDESTGVVTATSGVTKAGYLDETETASNTYGLSISEGGTFTPATTKQFLFQAGTYLTGDVYVDAMTSGSLSKPTISVDEKTGVVTATSGVSTAGYVGENETRSVTHALPVSEGGTVTPSAAKQFVLQAGTYLTGDVYVDAMTSRIVTHDTSEHSVAVVPTQSSNYTSAFTVGNIDTTNLMGVYLYCTGDTIANYSNPILLLRSCFIDLSAFNIHMMVTNATSGATITIINDPTVVMKINQDSIYVGLPDGAYVVEPTTDLMHYKVMLMYK